MQSGGTNTVSNSLLLGANSGNGTYTLSGGTLQTPNVIGSGTSTLNLNGGTLQASANKTAFVSGLTTANVQAGGAKIDSNGFAVTISQPLVHDNALGGTPDGGLTKLGPGTLTLGGVNTYTGGTTVSGGELVAAVNNALGTGNVIVLSSAAHLTLSAGVLDAINDSARLTLQGGGTPGVADVGFIALNGNVETVGTLTLGGTLYTSGVFTALTNPDYISGAGEIIVDGFLTGVPEPGTWTLLALGGAGLLGAALPRRARGQAGGGFLRASREGA